MTYTYHARKGISTPVQIILTILIIVIILGAIVVFTKQDTESIENDIIFTMEVENEDNIVNEIILENNKDTVKKPKEILELPNKEILWNGTVLAGTTSPLLNFNQTDYALALDSNKIIVLYFYANWGPTCKIEVSTALYPAFEELERSDVVGFRVNFNDNQTEKFEKELASEFGIAYQHTKIFIQNDIRILKSSELWTKDRYLDEINIF